jgi:hypothetical protein
MLKVGVIVLLDPNSDFKRAMNVIMFPIPFIIDGKGNIVEQHTTYAKAMRIKVEAIKKL